MFFDKVTPSCPSCPFGHNARRLQSAVRDLFPDGQTAVYDATLAGFRDIQKLNDDSASTPWWC